MQTLAGRNDAVDDGRDQAADSRTDNAAIRWVFAATLLFWLGVFAAGRALL